MLLTVVHAAGLLGARLLRLATGLLALSVIVFVLLRVVPGDVAGAIVGRDAERAAPETQREIERIQGALDLDRSLPEQYLLWITGPGRGDLGQGLWSRVPVFDEIRLASLKTAELVLLAAGVAAVLGVPLGLFGVRSGRYRWLPRLVALAGASFPAFWTGMMLFLGCLFWFNWVPNLDYRGLFREPWQNLQLYLLPSLALGLGMTGPVMGVVYCCRSSIGGGAEKATRWKPVRWLEVSNPSGLVAGFLATAVLLEVVFAIPGLGWLMARAVLERDLPTLQWLLLLFGALGWVLPGGRAGLPGPPAGMWSMACAGRIPTALGLVLVVGVAVGAVAGPWLTPFEPSRMDVGQRLLPPGLTHPLGSDDFGRDLLARLLEGGRVSLLTGALAAAVGVAAGAAAVWLEGRPPRSGARLVRTIVDLLSAFPPVILAMAVISMVGPTLLSVGLSVALVLVPGTARSLAREDRAWGLPSAPARLAVLAPVGTAALAQAILLEAHLSFLGLGPSPQGSTWGSLLGAYGPRLFEAAPWLAVFPGLAIGVTVLAFNLLSGALASWAEDRR